MLKHIVLWNLKPEAEGKTADENFAQVKELLEGLNGKISEIRKINVFPNAPDIQGNFDMALIAEFNSKKDLYAYQKNPLHEEIAVYVKKVVENRASIDYDFD
ncbi:MAG: Dabb family protein [Methanimicrococcus sp.]|nr:Dabb family protein [Methanimicrococcus sp.]